MTRITAEKITRAFYCFPVFALFIFTAAAIAENAEFKQIKGLEKQERETHAAAVIPVIVRPSVEFTAGELRDPFKEPSGKAVEEVDNSQQPQTEERLPELTVQGLVWGGKITQAIINNTVVKQGDTISGAKVITITKEGVTVLFKGKQYKLSPPAKPAGA